MAVPHRKRNRTENRDKIRKKSLLAENVADYSIGSGDVESIIRSMSSSEGLSQEISRPASIYLERCAMIADVPDSFLL